MVTVGKVGMFRDVASVTAGDVWYWGCLSV